MIIRMEDMTTAGFRRAVDEGRLFILPIGATEAHGRHLPLGTDTFQPQWVADELSERIDAVVAPAVPYGNHSSTRAMPGTVGLRFDTLRSLITDILGSLVEDGVRRILVISGHAGGAHLTAVKEACKDIVSRSDAKVMMLTDFDLALEFGKENGVDPADGHGGLMETARVMAIRPETVREDRSPGTFIDPGYMVLPDPENCFPQGMAGDPRKATPDLGRRMNLYIVDRLAAMIEKDMG